MVQVKPKKKVLIIVYYWPPSGGSGVQRWVKFVKYLREFDWEPIVYTPSNPERPAIDNSLEKDIPKDIEIIQTPIWEPYSFYKKFVGLKNKEQLGSGLMKSGSENTILQNLSIRIRGNFFIPDARKFWIKPSIKYLTSYIESNPVDAIISTGPPHSMHMIGLGLSKKTNLPWLADFRDPWTNIDFFADLRLSNFARKKHFRLEKEVLDKADKLVVVSPTMKKEFEEMTNTGVSVIPNGYDETDFPISDYKKSAKFTLSHVGMLTPSRNPQILWKAIFELCEANEAFKKDFRLQLIGKIDATIKRDIEKYRIKDQVIISDYIPHSEIVELQQKSEALLLIVNNTPNANLILTGKLFEYLASKRPIVCISPLRGDVSEVLENSGAGNVILYEEQKALENELMRLFELWKNGNNSHVEGSSSQFSRRNLTKKMAEELNSII